MKLIASQVDKEYKVMFKGSTIQSLTPIVFGICLIDESCTIALECEKSISN